MQIVTAVQSNITEYMDEMRNALEFESVEEVNLVIEELFRALRNRNKVFTLGNGGSASTATHLACDLSKWAVEDAEGGFRVMCLNDNIPLVSALTNDIGFHSIFEQQIATWVEPGDVVIIFSVNGCVGYGESGKLSENLLSAARLAKEKGAKTIAITGDSTSPLASAADFSLACAVRNKKFKTPITESFHVMVHHLICSGLKERIRDELQRSE